MSFSALFFMQKRGWKVKIITNEEQYWTKPISVAVEISHYSQIHAVFIFWRRCWIFQVKVQFSQILSCLCMRTQWWVGRWFSRVALSRVVLPPSKWRDGVARPCLGVLLHVQFRCDPTALPDGVRFLLSLPKYLLVIFTSRSSVSVGNETFEVSLYSFFSCNPFLNYMPALTVGFMLPLVPLYGLLRILSWR